MTRKELILRACEFNWAKNEIDEYSRVYSIIEELADCVDYLETAHFKCTMLAGRSTYSPEQFENGRYINGELAIDIKDALTRLDALLEKMK